MFELRVLERCLLCGDGSVCGLENAFKFILLPACS